MMDVNEDIINGAMCKQLSKTDLYMKEVVFSQIKARGPKTYFKRKVAIDSI